APECGPAVETQCIRCRDSGHRPCKRKLSRRHWPAAETCNGQDPVRCATGPRRNPCSHEPSCGEKTSVVAGRNGIRWPIRRQYSGRARQKQKWSDQQSERQELLSSGLSKFPTYAVKRLAVR